MFYFYFTSRGEKGIVADAGIVTDNDISRTIIVMIIVIKNDIYEKHR